MPTYEYRCKACGEHLEVVQGFRESALTECPACGGPLRKVFGSIGIAFKGTGFYRTDSRTGSSKARSGGTDGAKADTPSSAGGDAKPAKTESATKTGSSGSSGSSGSKSTTDTKSA